MHELLQCQAEVWCILHAGITVVFWVWLVCMNLQMNNGFCEYQGHLCGAGALWVSIEVDKNIRWFLLVSGSLR